MDDKTHTKHTANTGNQLNIPVDELKLGADDNALIYHKYSRRQTGYVEKCMRFQ